MNLEIFSKRNSLSVATLQSLRNIIPAAKAYVPTGTMLMPYICFSRGFTGFLRQSLSLLEKLYAKTIQHKVSLAD